MTSRSPNARVVQLFSRLGRPYADARTFCLFRNAFVYDASRCALIVKGAGGSGRGAGRNEERSFPADRLLPTATFSVAPTTTLPLKSAYSPMFSRLPGHSEWRIPVSFP